MHPLLLRSLIGEQLFYRGILGLLLMVFRRALLEPEVFLRTKTDPGKQIGILELFKVPGVFKKYLKCVLIGVPPQFAMDFSLSFARTNESERFVSINRGWNRRCLGYFGTAVGSIASGWINQKIRSRRLTILGFYFSTWLQF